MTRLNQTITRWQGMGLIATTLLGTGVFIIPQLTLQQAGNSAPWAWIILLLGVLPLAYVFAELGRHYTHAAGPAYFVEKAFGGFSGKVVGLLFLLAVPPGAAAAIIMSFEFIRPIIALTPEQQLSAELSVFAILFALNLRGLKLSGKIQLALTLAILAVVCLMLGTLLLSPPEASISAAAIQSTAISSTAINATEGILAAIGLAIWSFLGIEAITHLASEFKDVKKDFIPATLGGVTLVGLIFIGCTYLSMLAPDHELAMVGAFELLLGDSGRWIIGPLGLICGIATINVYFASLSRLGWSFSQEGILPAALQKVNQHNIPTVSLLTFILLSACMLIVSYSYELEFPVLAHWVNGAFVLIYTASMLAAWRLLSARHRPVIAMGLAVCCLFIYSLGNAMLYAIVLCLLISLGLMLQKRWQVRFQGA